MNGSSARFVPGVGVTVGAPDGIADDSIDRALRIAVAVNGQDRTGLSFVERTILVAFSVEDSFRVLGRRIRWIWRRIGRRPQ